jgi:hypothetical protein
MRTCPCPCQIALTQPALISAVIAARPPTITPGTKYSYSNFGYLVKFSPPIAARRHCVFSALPNESLPLYVQGTCAHDACARPTLTPSVLVHGLGMRQVLGRIVEKYGGTGYGTWVRNNLLANCGITGMDIAGDTLAARKPNEVGVRHPSLWGVGTSPWGVGPPAPLMTPCLFAPM